MKIKNEFALKQQIQYSTAFPVVLTYNLYELGNIWIDQLITVSVWMGRGSSLF